MRVFPRLDTSCVCNKASSEELPPVGAASSNTRGITRTLLVERCSRKSKRKSDRCASPSTAPTAAASSTTRGASHVARTKVTESLEHMLRSCSRSFNCRRIAYLIGNEDFKGSGSLKGTRRGPSYRGREALRMPLPTPEASYKWTPSPVKVMTRRASCPVGSSQTMRLRTLSKGPGPRMRHGR